MRASPTGADVRPAEDVEQPRVLLVDDHDLFRTGLVNLLTEQGVHVVGEAANGRGGGPASCASSRPDVVVMDINMPGITGVEATREIAAVAPRTRVVVLTISEEDNDVVDAVMAGACGYLLKDSSIEELVAGIHAAAAGESLISPHDRGEGPPASARRARSTASQPHRCRALRTRARRPEADRDRQGQRRDREGALHQPEDGQEPHLEHPDEAPDREPHPGRGLRGPERDRLAASSGLRTASARRRRPAS